MGEKCNMAKKIKKVDYSREKKKVKFSKLSNGR